MPLTLAISLAAACLTAGIYYGWSIWCHAPMTKDVDAVPSLRAIGNAYLDRHDLAGIVITKDSMELWDEQDLKDRAICGKESSENRATT